MNVRQDIAKIKSTTLGYEGHGCFTCMLHVNYGGGAGQGIGGYVLDKPVRDESDNLVCRIGTAYGMEFIARIIRACGVESWEQIAGRTIYVLRDLPPGDSGWGTGSDRVLGIENLPTEKGERFLFADLAAEFEEVDA